MHMIVEGDDGSLWGVSCADARLVSLETSYASPEFLRSTSALLGEVAREHRLTLELGDQYRLFVPSERPEWGPAGHDHSSVSAGQRPAVDTVARPAVEAGP